MSRPDADAIVGCLLGQAVGDMMGLPAKNLSPRRTAKLFPTFNRPQFVFGYGMGSDDTGHARLTAQALLQSGGEIERFGRELRRGLRWWFAEGRLRSSPVTSGCHTVSLGTWPTRSPSRCMRFCAHQTTIAWPSRASSVLAGTPILWRQSPER